MNNNIALGHRKGGGEKKLVGIVQIVTGDKRAKLTLMDKDRDGNAKKFSNGDISLTVSLADLPKRPSIKPNQKQPKEYRIRMSAEGDTVEAITPVRGLHRGRLVDLGKRENKDADPAPYEKVWNEGSAKENRYLEFFAVYEITDGPFRGVQLPAYNLHYKFEESQTEEGFTQFSGNPDNPKATRLHQLMEWGQVHGNIWSEPIRWPDDGNILPELLERVLDNDLEVNLFMDKGYIQSIQPVEDDEFETEDDGDDSEDDSISNPELDDDDEPDFLKDPDEEVKPVEVAAPKASPKKGATKKTVKQVVEDDDL